MFYSSLVRLSDIWVHAQGFADFVGLALCRDCRVGGSGRNQSFVDLVCKFLCLRVRVGMNK